MNPLKVKICCISSIEEAATAIAFGASALGLVGHMPSGPGVISDELIAAIAATVPPPVATFLLTNRTDAAEIISHQKLVNTNTLQLVDAIPLPAYQLIREALPAVKIVQVIHVQDESSLEEAIEVSAYADALLLDSGNPKLGVKILGGTGRTHNWLLSKQICEQSKIPVFLAGGLHAGNVREAIETVQPFGLDLCSGVRTNGQLDSYKLELFFKAIYN